ncbi:MAG: YicC family protein [Succinivibrio sp.]|uniref:YicC/YloC family endoribonuclease n=1 Tax=Succinivibrio sp. TaxID=2053619 RepID=UPI001B131BFE|nr:YicC family protein [Succinivibrio sp.]MCI7252714.1 YicC family protein [Succinatimonas sp.]MDD6376660.1 YicC family protein [Succinatimonas sp.]MDY5993737.1 YicC/YloC family endoribonuclease [Succinivibrio sp.]
MEPIFSMTGSANCIISIDLADLNIDITSVNGRFLELNFKMPDSLRHLESKLREAFQKKLKRGKVDCYITLSQNLKSTLKVNKSALEQLSIAIKTIEKGIGGISTNALEILNYPGIQVQDENVQSKIDDFVLNSLETAISKLVTARAHEGEKLKLAIQSRLESIEKELLPVEKALSELVFKEREKIKAKIAELSIEIDPNRIEQEVTLVAQKADVREEYDRLKAHIKEVRSILQTGGICGKRLDFMMQEFNREANTLASKASSLDITKVAVELKVLIEQMREQVQNIE